MSLSVSPLSQQLMLALSTAQETQRARRLRSRMKVLWRRTAKATAALGELRHAALMLWIITQVHECGTHFLSLNERLNLD
jgi:hypothetical protein